MTPGPAGSRVSAREHHDLMRSAALVTFALRATVDTTLRVALPPEAHAEVSGVSEGW